MKRIIEFTIHFLIVTILFSVLWPIPFIVFYELALTWHGIDDSWIIAGSSGFVAGYPVFNFSRWVADKFTQWRAG
jgi:hypothetical protein